jgi:DNA uptake protein ComE-like DNA-binding protein
MSVTQSTRVIAFRERRAGFDSIEQLESVPGVGPKLLAKLKRKLTA